MISKTLVITHGDVDGATAAALELERLGIAPENIRVIFTQPFLINKVVIPDDIEEIYVLDIAPNNRDIQMTIDFYRLIEDRLVNWYDHHEGWHSPELHILTISQGGKVIAQTARACAAMLGHSTDLRVINAIVADTREGELQLDGALIDEAIKSDMRNDEIRLAAVKLLIGDESQRLVLETAAKAYGLIQGETSYLAVCYTVDGQDNYRDHCGKVVIPKGTIAFVDVPAEYVKTYGQEKPPGRDYDLTQLLLKGQELANFAVARTISPDGREVVTIATKSGVNLVELFELPSGAPFRVSLPAEKLEEVVEKLHNLNLDERPCQCGSGEPWTICHANSPYCG